MLEMGILYYNANHTGRVVRCSAGYCIEEMTEYSSPYADRWVEVHRTPDLDDALDVCDELCSLPD